MARVGSTRVVSCCGPWVPTAGRCWYLASACWSGCGLTARFARVLVSPCIWRCVWLLPPGRVTGDAVRGHRYGGRAPHAAGDPHVGPAAARSVFTQDRSGRRWGRQPRRLCLVLLTGGRLCGVLAERRHRRETLGSLRGGLVPSRRRWCGSDGRDGRGQRSPPPPAAARACVRDVRFNSTPEFLFRSWSSRTPAR